VETLIAAQRWLYGGIASGLGAFVTGLIPCPLTTFIMSCALARGMLAAGLTVTAAMTVGMVATIGGVAVAAAFARNRFVDCLVRTENWRHRAGLALEVGSAIAVIGVGVWTVLRSVQLA
jgi:ABC-type nickel/cobalt efflux system permease component RcnA